MTLANKFRRFLQVFFQPKILYESKDSVDLFVRGLLASRAQTLDRMVTKELTNRLFADKPPNGPGTDLVSLNLQRARDHGVARKLRKTTAGLGQCWPNPGEMYLIFVASIFLYIFFYLTFQLKTCKNMVK